MNVFSVFTAHVQSAVKALAAAGVFAQSAGPLADRGGAAPGCGPWRSRDQCRDGPRQGGRPQAPRTRRAPGGGTRQASRRSPGSKWRARDSSTSPSIPRFGGTRCVPRSSPGRSSATATSARRAGQCRIRLGQSHRAPACRPLPRRRVRRCTGQSAGVQRLRGDPRILHQRCRRPGRRARPLRLSALPRGARRGHRSDPGRFLSRRLSQAGRRSFGRRVRPQPQPDAGADLAADRARQGDRDDDGGDPAGSRRSSMCTTMFFSPSAR